MTPDSRWTRDTRVFFFQLRCSLRGLETHRWEVRLLHSKQSWVLYKKRALVTVLKLHAFNSCEHLIMAQAMKSSCSLSRFGRNKPRVHKVQWILHFCLWNLCGSSLPGVWGSGFSIAIKFTCQCIFTKVLSVSTCLRISGCFSLIWWKLSCVTVF